MSAWEFDEISGRLEPIGDGSFGDVYRLPGWGIPSLGTSDVAVKVYKPGPRRRDRVQFEALSQMIAYAAKLGDWFPEMAATAAWPCRIIADKGAPIGYAMPLVPERFQLEWTTVTGERTRIPAHIFHATQPDATLARHGVSMGDEARLRLALAAAEAFAFMHAHDVVVCDVSGRNLLFALSGTQASTYMVDCDSMSLAGRSPLPGCETDGWRVGELHPDEPHSTKAADQLKLGLLILRLLSGEPGATRPYAAPIWAPSDVREALRDALQANPASRPSAGDWVRYLREATPVRPSAAGTVLPITGATELAQALSGAASPGGGPSAPGVGARARASASGAWGRMRSNMAGSARVHPVITLAALWTFVVGAAGGYGAVAFYTHGNIAVTILLAVALLFGFLVVFDQPGPRLLFFLAAIAGVAVPFGALSQERALPFLRHDLDQVVRVEGFTATILGNFQVSRYSQLNKPGGGPVVLFRNCPAGSRFLNVVYRLGPRAEGKRTITLTARYPTGRGLRVTQRIPDRAKPGDQFVITVPFDPRSSPGRAMPGRLPNGRYRLMFTDGELEPTPSELNVRCA